MADMVPKPEFEKFEAGSTDVELDDENYSDMTMVKVDVYTEHHGTYTRTIYQHDKRLNRYRTSTDGYVWTKWFYHRY